MQSILQQIINVLQLGSIYALLAIGFSMVYGIIGLVNFAHGDFFMVSAYITFLASAVFFALGLPPLLVLLLAIAVSMIGTAIVMVLVERFAYRPLRDAPKVSAVVTSLAVSMLIQNLMLYIMGPSARRMPDFIEVSTIQIGSAFLENKQILIIIAALVMMVILDQFVMKTKIGMAMRAVSHDKEASYLMGIPINRIISLTFAIGAMAAAVSGGLFTIAYPIFDPYIGTMISWWSFVSAVVGGIGNMRGAVLGGYCLATVTVFTPALLSSSSYRDLVAFGLLIIVLLVKPSGLLGKKAIQKV